MTKKTEIELLDATIKAFGTDSYLGPWLAEYRDTLVRDISCDVCMTAPMPRAAMAEAERILESAKEQAALIKKNAETAALQMIAKAEKESKETRAYVKHLLISKASEMYV